MRFPKKKRPLALIALALAVCLAGILPQLSALAENTVDVTKECSLVVSVPEQFSKDYEGILDLSIPVKLYRVAKMENNGDIGDPTEGFASFTNLSSQFNSESTAEQLRTLADALEKHVKENDTVEPLREMEVKGTAKIEGLPVGLYLLVSDTVLDHADAYVFQSSLLSLPTTEEFTVPVNPEGSEAAEEEGDEAEAPEEPEEPSSGRVLHGLRYDWNIALKISHEDRYGSLVISKTLDSYNTTLGTTTFVFEIAAAKDGKEIYKGVKALTFNGPGENEVVIDHLLVGAEVTVKEIYSGASYSLTSDQVVAAVIPAPEDGPAVAEFVNTYNGGHATGTSVTNHFTLDESAGIRDWSAQQLVDSNDQPAIAY